MTTHNIWHHICYVGNKIVITSILLKYNDCLHEKKTFKIQVIRIIIIIIILIVTRSKAGLWAYFNVIYRKIIKLLNCR